MGHALNEAYCEECKNGSPDQCLRRLSAVFTQHLTEAQGCGKKAAEIWVELQASAVWFTRKGRCVWYRA